MASPRMIELINVTKRFEFDGVNIDVLRDLNLCIARAESVAIVGPSGSGKSTLLNIIGTLDSPTTGEILLDGENLRSLKPNQIAALRNRKIGFVFQQHHLLPQCTILENVLLPTLALPRKDPHAEARAERLLDRVGLAPRKNHRPGQLSGGERQRAAVVRALINQPELLLADEPTGSLDSAASENLRELFLELNHEEKVALVVVTHSPELARGMSRTLAMRDGELSEN